MNVLFTDYKLGDLDLPNRIVMAPMTRCMADDNLVPTAAVAEYYARRADAGLIITEGSIIRPDGQGYPHTPGIYNEDQVEGWRMVTDKVHSLGGRMFLQLWHVGRVSHPVYLNGEPPVAPSAVPLKGTIPRFTGRKDSAALQYGTPRALDIDEIPLLVEAYANGASKAIKAGFDGVEIHGANGYLIDQFLHHNTNRRADAYGGAPDKMARFAIEVVDAIISKVGNRRVGIRLSPAVYYNIEPDRNDTAVFRYLLRRLEERDLAYTHTGIHDDSIVFDPLGDTPSGFLRKNYKGTLIGCGSYTPEVAERAISSGAIDLVAMGRPFIANPDLIKKIRNREPLTPYDKSMLKTFV